MPKRNVTYIVCNSVNASTAQAELQRHIDSLKLSGVQAYQAWCREQGFSASLHKNWKQRREELRRAARLEAYDNACAERARHIRTLGLDSVEDYEAWCRRLDFSVALRKREEQWAQERRAAERERAVQAMADSRRLQHRPEELIRAIYEKRVPWKALRNAYQQKIHQIFTRVTDRPRAREALLRLLLHVHQEASLQTVEPAIASLGPQPYNTFPDALLLLALRHRHWIRPPEAWKPATHNARRQFSALARHLLARYDVPTFLDAAWFEGENETARRHQDWFLHIAGGQNIRTADLPVALTKMAAHHFLQAPREVPITGALRWGQVHGLGGDERLARAVIGSRLSEILPDEPFWATVLQFFVNCPMLDPARVGPIVDYIYHQKFVTQQVLGPDGKFMQVAPPQPNFSMKGRTAAALQRLVETWHRQLAQEEKRPPLEWPKSGIGEFRLLQCEESSKKQVRCWTIHELLSSKELREEGRAMHNCVASYADSCARGHCSIWSLRVTAPQESRRRVMTIEVNTAKRTIVQARGPCNRTPEHKHVGRNLKIAPEMLRRWADQQKLTIADYVW